MKDPSANFTRLNPGVTGSSSSCAGVLGVASALTPGQFGGRGNVVPGILVGFKGAAWNAAGTEAAHGGPMGAGAGGNGSGGEVC